MQPTTKSFYLLPEWIGLMERWGNLKVHRLELTGEHGGKLRAVVYSRNSQVMQPLHQPYLGLEFEPTPTTQPARITRQWHEVADQFLTQLRALGWNHWLTLPPDITDPRPFAWAGAVVTPRYTYYLPPTGPAPDRGESPEIPRKARKAAKDGYTIARNDDLDAVVHNITSTERRQEFSHALTKTQLQEALTALGPERLRIYNAYDRNGQPACSILVLYEPGSVIQDWIAATAAEHLKSGVTQLTRAALFDDLRTLDAPAFDFCGANIPSVAAAKSEFGASLTPYYMIEPPNFRWLMRSLRNLFR